MRLNINTKSTCFAALLGVSLMASSHAVAKDEEIGDDGYNKTYDDPSKSFKTRMKEIRATPEVSVDNSKGGLFLGIHGNFGPVYDAEPTSSSGMGFGIAVEPGYAIQSSSWNRMELGVLVGYNSFAWKGGEGVNSTMTPLIFIPRFGYGFSLGDNLFGMLRVGFGIATGQVANKYSNDIDKEYFGSGKTDSKTGFVFSGDYDVVYGQDKVQFVGGLGVTHYQYAFSKVGPRNVDAKLNLNYVNVHGGARFAF
jgi:hypothetical protein